MKSYFAFGDESSRPDLSTYALVIFSEDIYDNLHDVVAQTFKDFDLCEDQRIHCRKIFSKDNVIFQTLGADGIYNFFLELLTRLYSYNVRFSIGGVVKPDSLLKQYLLFLNSKNETEEFSLEDKNYTPLAFFSATMPVLDRLREHNHKFFVSEEGTKIDHFGKNKKVHNTLNLFSSSVEKLNPVVCPAASHIFLDVADIVSYLGSAALYPTGYKFNEKFKKKSQTILSKVYPIISEFRVNQSLNLNDDWLGTVERISDHNNLSDIFSIVD